MATDTKALYLRVEARFKDADSVLLKMRHTFVNSPGNALQPGTPAEPRAADKHGPETNYNN